MKTLLERLYENSPHFIQNIFVTGFNFFQYRKRYANAYTEWKTYFKEKEFASSEELQKIQQNRLHDFLQTTIEESIYYREKYKGIDVKEITTATISLLPAIDKEEIRTNIETIYSLPKSKAYVSKTGGTTGKSLEVRYFWSDMQERMAMLDYFRERFDFRQGVKTAWFSGKALLSEKDLQLDRYWKTDLLNKIRYYSTFHINRKSAQFYIKNLNRYQPLFFVGFPSSLVEIAKEGLRSGLALSYQPIAIFPTAETLVFEEVKLLEEYFKCGVYNQYASSEGAPFITECEHRKLHFEVLSGIIEVLDTKGNPAQEGRMLVTAFATKGTPLIRYDIGDMMKWSQQQECDCGRQTPIVESIQGRINDFIYSEETGRINLGNITNSIKYVKGIIKFQIIQNHLGKIEVLIVKDNLYEEKDEVMFLRELRHRVGNKMEISFQYLTDIKRENSGKHRVVKNNIKHLLES